MTVIDSAGPKARKSWNDDETEDAIKDHNEIRDAITQTDSLPVHSCAFYGRDESNPDGPAVCCQDTVHFGAATDFASMGGEPVGQSTCQVLGAAFGDGESDVWASIASSYPNRPEPAASGGMSEQ